MCLAVALALSAAARPGASATPGDAPKAGAAAAPPPPSGGGPFEFGSFGKSKEPVTVISDTLEYDYKANVVVYRGNVVATQAATKLTSDVLTITMDNDKQNGNQGAKPKAPAAAGDPPADPPAEQPPASSDTGRVQVIVATGNVRIDQGTRWAVGGRATYEQQGRTLVLTENPVLHDGPNEVVGDRVIVYLDENRSVVEGGQKRVKAVLYPNDKNSGAPAKPKAASGRPAGRATARETR